MKITRLKAGMAARKLKSSMVKNATQERLLERSLGVVLDSEEAGLLQAFRELGRELEVRKENVHFLFCSERPKKEEESVYFSLADLSWSGSIINSEVESFLKKDFDTLIVYTKTETPASKFIVRNCSAGLKIGRTGDTTAPYDLNISSDHGEVAVFIGELKKYSRIIEKRH